MSKRKKTNIDEEYGESFRRYSIELHDRSKKCKREPPSMMLTPDLGSPKKVWSLLCSKDEINKRNWMPLDKHTEITGLSRCMIVDWLMEVSTSLKLHRETFHLAIDYFDRYLYVAETFPLRDLQLVATSCMAIACKFEEIYPPKIAALADFTDGACSANDVIAYEQIILTQLNWNFNPVTAIHWLAFYLQLLAKTNEENHAAETIAKTFANQLHHDDTTDIDVNTSFSDSFLRSIDGVSNALNDSICSTSGPKKINNEDGNRHIYVGESLSIPKLLRDDFVQLSKVVDLLILDHNFLRFRYSELAAAVLFCSFTESDVIEKITSIKKDSISELITKVQIFADFCEERYPCSNKSFVIEDIDTDELHNIQRYDDNNLVTLKQLVQHHKAKADKLKRIEQIYKQQKENDVLKEQNV